MSGSKNTLNLCNPWEALVFSEKSDLFRQLTDTVREGKNCIGRGIPQEAKGYVLSYLFKYLSRDLVLCVSGNHEAEAVISEIETFLGGENVIYLPAWEILPGEHVHPHIDLVGERMSALIRITGKGVPALIVTTVDALQHKVPAPWHLFESVIGAKSGEYLNFVNTQSRLSDIGYERVKQVSFKGEFCVRGGIIDVFPSNSDYPVRIDFDGDTVSSVRLFDASNQRSFEKKDAVSIAPADETLMMAPGKICRATEYFPPDAVLVLDDPEELARKAEKNRAMLAHKGPEEFEKIEYLFGSERQKIILDEGAAGKFRQFREINFRISRIEYFRPGTDHAALKNVFGSAVSDLKRTISERKKIFIFGNNTGEIERLAEILREEKVPVGKIDFSIGRLRGGFSVDDAEVYMLTDQEILGRYKIQRPRRKFYGSIAPMEISELKTGDYVVHIDHGIGRYLGLTGMEKDGMISEMALIEYADNSKLYVPLSKFNLIQRYIGLKDRKPALDRLGSRKWLYKKAKAQKAIMDYSSELLKTQAARNSAAGFSFSEDSIWQKEFEASFIYEETPDQNSSLVDIKNDMESRRTMDRLICGDVGYGKTEVAMRAAFKSVMDAKQVAVLVPTTILAKQHYDTFSERMADYPVCIEMLSRFKTASEQNDIIGRLKNGKVDIIIGTHRILQDDVEFKDLGLVVIDEEQRFGVLHKEKLKRFRLTVDVLAMSATPIPRTLYMSLAGARDISTITTPPEDRLPVETYVGIYDKAVIKEAILREIGREGQIFYIHNRVDSIGKACSELAEAVPQARFAYAHGQMHEHELESIMSDFVSGKIDVLVSTTIIESGIDIPNANTIIIERADMFGLADLYQLRGRVGRFKRRAYAYLLTLSDASMTSDVKKRLYAMKKFSSLGSGFKVALKDLEIRGAGNIIGKEQHGHVSLIGFDLYCKLLRQAVAELRGKKVREVPAAHIDLALYLRIPEAYVEDETERTKIYIMIASAAWEKEIDTIARDMEDRFGPVPRPVSLMLLVAKLRFSACSAGVSSIEVTGNRLVIRKKGRRLHYNLADIGCDINNPEKLISTVKNLLQGI
ncbi:MAG: transcription-repair coupling factor [Candidatus Aureabacteria bacterium]|nr:transcription-repair coupling factor [Candidatus Auribacterota bacterium]